MRRPAEVAHDALARGRAEPLRASVRSASATSAASRPRGPSARRIVEQPFASMFDERAQARQRRRDDGQADGHVLEDLQRRPVEPEPQRAVPRRIERRDADVGGGQRRRQRGVRQRAR